MANQFRPLVNAFTKASVNFWSGFIATAKVVVEKADKIVDAIDYLLDYMDRAITPVRTTQALQAYNPQNDHYSGIIVVAGTALYSMIQYALGGQSKKTHRSKLNALLEAQQIQAPIQSDKDELNKICDELQLAYEFEIKEDGEHLRLKRKTQNAQNADAKLYSFKLPEVAARELNWFERFVKKMSENKVFQLIFSPPWQAATSKASIAYWILWISAVFITSSIAGIPIIATMVGGFVGVATLSIPAMLIIGLPVLYGFVSMARDYYRRIRALAKGEPIVKPDDIDETERAHVYRTLYKAKQIKNDVEALAKLEDKAPDGKAPDAVAGSNPPTAAVKEKEISDNSDEMDQPLLARIPSKNSGDKVSSNTGSAPVAAMTSNQRYPWGSVIWAGIKGAVSGYSGGFFMAWVATSFIGTILLKAGVMAGVAALASGPAGLFILLGFAVVGLVAFGVYAGVKASEAYKQQQQFKQDNQQFLGKTDNYQATKDIVRSEILQKKQVVADVNIEGHNAEKSKQQSGSNVKKTALSINEHFNVFLGKLGSGSFVARSLLIGGVIAFLVATAHPGAVITLPVIIGVVAACALVWGTAMLIDHIREKRKQKQEMQEKTDPILQTYELQKLNDLNNTLNTKLQPTATTKPKSDDGDHSDKDRDQAPERVLALAAQQQVAATGTAPAAATAPQVGTQVAAGGVTDSVITKVTIETVKVSPVPSMATMAAKELAKIQLQQEGSARNSSNGQSHESDKQETAAHCKLALYHEEPTFKPQGQGNADVIEPTVTHTAAAAA